MRLKIVVLPQPDGPMMLTKSRALMSKERSSSTRTSPALPGKDFRTFRTLNWTGDGCIATAYATCMPRDGGRKSVWSRHWSRPDRVIAGPDAHAVGKTLPVRRQIMQVRDVTPA